MAKLYSKDYQKQANTRKPRKETIMFLLNYSKALKVSNLKELQFETFLN